MKQLTETNAWDKWREPIKETLQKNGVPIKEETPEERKRKDENLEYNNLIQCIVDKLIPLYDAGHFKSKSRPNFGSVVGYFKNTKKLSLDELRTLYHTAEKSNNFSKTLFGSVK